MPLDATKGKEGGDAGEEEAAVSFYPAKKAVDIARHRPPSMLKVDRSWDGTRSPSMKASRSLHSPRGGTAHIVKEAFISAGMRSKAAAVSASRS